LSDEKKILKLIDQLETAAEEMRVAGNALIAFGELRRGKNLSDEADTVNEWIAERQCQAA